MGFVRTSRYSSNPKSLDARFTDRKSVLFVCMCNICRSPAAKSIFDQYVERQGLAAEFYSDSAGVTLDAYATKPTFAMRWAAFRRGYPMKRQARRISRLDLKRFDMVIAVDRRVLNELRHINTSPKSTIKLLSDFLPEYCPCDVPDPMNRSKEVCNKVLDLLEQACPFVVNAMLNPRWVRKSCA